MGILLLTGLVGLTICLALNQKIRTTFWIALDDWFVASRFKKLCNRESFANALLGVAVVVSVAGTTITYFVKPFAVVTGFTIIAVVKSFVKIVKHHLKLTNITWRLFQKVYRLVR